MIFCLLQSLTKAAQINGRMSKQNNFNIIVQHASCNTYLGDANSLTVQWSLSQAIRYLREGRGHIHPAAMTRR